ncbi:MAG TPA: TIGR03619 family F420-dependent LLM class oxidoreductase [Chloroflexota bacterium]|nr:TIGR03619 family F420-dependent LLM class oxidoreductase [Chloroflexota bacterium]
MEIGCHLPTQGAVATREALLTFCREAEAREIASLWVSDHVVFPRTETGEHPGGPFPFPSDMAYLEAVVALSAAASVTERAKLGASVFILGHRHPVVMAKMLSTIDVLSGGRLICGVGVGWWEEELSLLGVPYRQRGRQADEMIKVFKTLWTDDHPSFEGRFYTIPDVGFSPKPLQKPHPPIVVGGDSPGAFKRTVELADGWHATAATPEQAAAALNRLRAAAETAGRPFESIALSIRFNVKAAPGSARSRRQEIVGRLAAYKALGFGEVLLDFRRDSLDEMLDDLDAIATEIRPVVDRA